MCRHTRGRLFRILRAYGWRLRARDGRPGSLSRAAFTPCDARESWPATSVAGHFLHGLARHRISKTARSHCRDPAEDVREMALIGEPHRTGNLAHREICLVH